MGVLRSMEFGSYRARDDIQVVFGWEEVRVDEGAYVRQHEVFYARVQRPRSDGPPEVLESCVFPVYEKRTALGKWFELIRKLESEQDAEDLAHGKPDRSRARLESILAAAQEIEPGAICKKHLMEASEGELLDATNQRVPGELSILSESWQGHDKDLLCMKFLYQDDPVYAIVSVDNETMLEDGIESECIWMGYDELQRLREVELEGKQDSAQAGPTMAEVHRHEQQEEERRYSEMRSAGIDPDEPRDDIHPPDDPADFYGVS